jgi:dihydrofolate reductase
MNYGPDVGRVVADITVSLDGFVAAPGVDLAHGLGRDGAGLHVWALAGSDEDTAILDEALGRTGAVIMGRTLFDIVDGPEGWSDTMAYGADRDPANPPPCFVVTHTQPPHVRLTDRMTIVTTGPEDALAQAREAAGGRDVVIMGGGAIIASYLAAGLVDELSLHIAPLALGGGTRLFDRHLEGFELVSCVPTRNAIHVSYRVARPGGS